MNSPLSFRRATLIGLALVACISTAGVFLIHDRIDRDADEYVRFAENINTKNNFSYDGVTPSRARQPLYPALLSVIYWRLGKSQLVVDIFQALLNLISFLIAMRLFRRWFSNDSPILAALMVALYAPIWVTCGYLLAESLVIMLTLLYLLLLDDCTRQTNYKKALLAGFVLGLAILTKPITVALLVMVWLPILFLEQSFRRRLATLATIILGSIVLLLPWTIRNGIECGFYTPLSAEGGEHLLYASNPIPNDDPSRYIEAGPVHRSNDEKQRIATAIDNIRKNPFQFVRHGIATVINAWDYVPGSGAYSTSTPVRILSHLVQISILALFVIGIWRLRRSQKVMLIYPPIAFTIVLAFSYATGRHLLPILPVVLCGAASGLTIVVSGSRRLLVRISVGV